MKTINALRSLDTLLECTDSCWDTESIKVADLALKLADVAITADVPQIGVAALLLTLKLHVKAGLAAMDKPSGVSPEGKETE
jgi:hypothetical protein